VVGCGGGDGGVVGCGGEFLPGIVAPCVKPA
jgi:hypothetical protein